MYLAIYNPNGMQVLSNEWNPENRVVMYVFYSIDEALLFINDRNNPLHWSLFTNTPLQLVPKA